MQIDPDVKKKIMTRYLTESKETRYRLATTFLSCAVRALQGDDPYVGLSFKVEDSIIKFEGSDNSWKFRIVRGSISKNDLAGFLAFVLPKP